MGRDDKKNMLIDFSQESINRYVIRSTIEHPAVTLSSALSVLGIAGMLILEPSLWFIGSAISGGVLALGAWGVNYGLRQHHFARLHVERLMHEVEKRRASKMKEIGKVLSDAELKEGVHQFERLNEKFRTFQGILDKKLDRSELSYGRYLGIAEQVYLSALDNLGIISNLLKSAASIDEGYTLKRLDEIKGRESVGQSREAGALAARLELLQKQTDRIAELFSKNEEAMTQMDIAIAAIAEMRTEDRQASMDMESAMLELNRLVKNAEKLSS